MVLHFLQNSLKVSSPTLLPNTRILNPTTRFLIPRTTRNNIKGCVPKQRSTRTRKNTRFGQSTILSRLLQRKISPRSLSKENQQKAPSEPEHQQNSTDPVFYREVDMSDIPSQYAEEVETFRQILDLPNPRETLPRSSTTVLGLDDEKGQHELRPRGPSAILPLNSILKDAFEKFEHISTPWLQQPNTTRWDNLVLKTKSRSSIQILPRSVFLLSPLGPLWARFPYKF